VGDDLRRTEIGNRHSKILERSAAPVELRFSWFRVRVADDSRRVTVTVTCRNAEGDSLAETTPKPL
jgi:hypothetical protein